MRVANLGFLVALGFTAQACNEPTVIPTPPPSEQREFFLQNGFQGYNGNKDAVLTRMTNYIEEEGQPLVVDSYKYTPIRSAIHFDLKNTPVALPACNGKVDVVRAILYLHRIKHWIISGNHQMGVQLFGRSEKWHSFLTLGNVWNAALNYDVPELDTTWVQDQNGHAGNNREWVAFTVPRSLIKEWICKPASNNGFVLKSASEDDYVFKDPRGYAFYFSSKATSEKKKQSDGSEKVVDLTELRPLLYLQFSDAPAAGGAPNPSGRTAGPDLFAPLNTYQIIRGND